MLDKTVKLDSKLVITNKVDNRDLWQT
uniref:Uncharacterized protein n=1 Tax=Rhizophora mucronata TaxID=61149 RepID=A0A2P2JRY1_RHIMU